MGIYQCTQTRENIFKLEKKHPKPPQIADETCVRIENEISVNNP